MEHVRRKAATVLRRERESGDGLIIKLALYGTDQESLEHRTVINGEEVPQLADSEDDRDYPCYVNVTEALQCLVSTEHQLRLPSGCKHRGLEGFYDMAPDQLKYLYVRYEYAR